ncbi:hypothetical protein BUALT_Bualt12G0079700 [Buddleja alternifolia]|uniref:F-box domain-containing protein n=1 Tax=Buddleja alternifolia TaxID=168488 RepID=A0AAV6WPD8_9LAMI|nr:hypothetical protein BUALT_Bualt12G0079700 [Buddleja alternifolia]
MSYEEELLPHDVIIEILSWLPPENLLKFKRVCRSWGSTITRDAKFIAKHNLRNKNTNGRIIIVTEDYPNPYEALKLRILSDTNPAIIQDNTKLVSPQNKRIMGCYRVMSSCNGLFCYASGQGDYGIQLCNPCARWATRIPHIRFTNNISQVDLYYGVGYDPFTNDYKVIKLRPTVIYPVFIQPGEVAIYSVKAKTWRRLDVQVPPDIPMGRSIFLHENNHWLAYTVSPFRIEKIMLFNVCNNVFGEIQLPAIDPNKISSISVVKGSLCLLVTNFFAHNRICQVWMMKEYGVAKSWTKKCSVVLRNDITRCIEVTPAGKIMCSIESNARNGKMVKEPIPPTLVLYDPETDEYRNVGGAPSFRHAFSLEASLKPFDCAI